MIFCILSVCAELCGGGTLPNRVIWCESLLLSALFIQLLERA